MVKLQLCKKETQGKSTLVRVSARSELARVRVIGSQLYSIYMTQQENIIGKRVTPDEFTLVALSWRRKVHPGTKSLASIM